jgi:hypothetical protein
MQIRELLLGKYFVPIRGSIIWKLDLSVKEICLPSCHIYIYLVISKLQNAILSRVYKMTVSFIVLLILLSCHLSDKKAPIVVEISYRLMLISC